MGKLARGFHGKWRSNGLLHSAKLSAADIIIAVVGLHANYAMALFKNSFDTTLNEYLIQNRLSHAQRLLATTDEKILSIAFDSGLGTLSRFNDAFKTAFKCTPKTYRNIHRTKQSHFSHGVQVPYRDKVN